MERKKILFIVNPFSGVGRHKSIEKILNTELDHTQFDYRVVYTEARHHATTLAGEAIAEGFGIIVAVGGDGTVNEIAREMVGKDDLLFGIIPSGSGNGLARHLNIPLVAERAVQCINKLNTRKIDTAVVNDQFFINIAGIGFDALVAKKFANEKRRGFLKYFGIAVKEYLRYRPSEYIMTVNGKKIRRKALFISFANSDQFGYNTSIAPQAAIDDGYMDISIMKKIPLWKVFLIAPLLFIKQINRSGYIEVIRAREVEVIRDSNTINLDGEPVRLGKKLKIKIIPKSLNVIVPEEFNHGFDIISKVKAVISK